MKKVAILGRALGWRDAPFNDSAFEIWGLNRAYQSIQQTGGRWSRWFDMHDIRDISHRKALAGLNVPVYTLRNYPDIPNGILYPLDEIKKEFFGLVNREHFFRNSIAYMIALAIYEGFNEIRLYGINQNGPRYEPEIPCVSFWLGVALGRGIKLVIQKHSNLLNPETLYK